MTAATSVWEEIDQAFIERVVKNFDRTVNRGSHRRLEFDEMIQVANETAYKALSTYDGKGNKNAYLVQRIKWGLGLALRRERAAHHEYYKPGQEHRGGHVALGVNGGIEGEESDGYTPEVLRDYAPTDEVDNRLTAESTVADTMEWLEKKFSPQMVDRFKRRFMYGHQLRDIAAADGITHQAVCEGVNKVLAAVRERVHANG